MNKEKYKKLLDLMDLMKSTQFVLDNEYWTNEEDDVIKALINKDFDKINEIYKSGACEMNPFPVNYYFSIKNNDYNAYSAWVSSIEIGVYFNTDYCEFTYNPIIESHDALSGSIYISGDDVSSDILGNKIDRCVNLANLNMDVFKDYVHNQELLYKKLLNKMKKEKINKDF